MQTNTILSLATFALIAAVPSVNGATLIDNFSLPGSSSTVQIAPDANPQVVVSALPGGTSRTTTFMVTSFISPFALTGGIGGGFLVAGFSAIAAGEVTLDYVFGSTLDLSGESLLEIVSAGSSGWAANMTISTSAGDLVLNTTLPEAASLLPHYFQLASFAGTGNLAQVTGFRLALTGGGSSNFVLDSISATPTPEPGTALLLALPVLAVLRLRKN